MLTPLSFLQLLVSFDEVIQQPLPNKKLVEEWISDSGHNSSKANDHDEAANGVGKKGGPCDGRVLSEGLAESLSKWFRPVTARAPRDAESLGFCDWGQGSRVGKIWEATNTATTPFEAIDELSAVLLVIGVEIFDGGAYGGQKDRKDDFMVEPTPVDTAQCIDPLPLIFVVIE